MLATWSGDIPNGTVWDNTEVQLITSDARVPAGSTLTILPGTVVKFQAFSTDLRIEGTLNANGTGAQNIIFTEFRDDIGGDTNGDGNGSAPAAGNWGRIEVTGSATIRHAEVRYGGFSSGGQVQVDGGTLTLENSVSGHSVGDGVRVQNADPSLQNNTYQHNASAAVSMDLNSNPDIDGVSVSNNAINGLQVDSGTLERNLSWNDPDIVYWLDHDVTVPDGLTLTVDAGQVVKFSNFAADLFVDGTLDVNGTAQAPVVFTEHRDDSAGGDTNSDANGSSPAQGNWGRIEMRDTSSGNTIHHADIRFGGFGSVGQLTVTDSDLLLANSTVQESVADGVRIQGSNAVLQTNTFENNNDAAASMDLNANPDIDGVVVTNNGINGLRVDTGALEQNLTWNDPDIVYWLDHDVTVPSGLTLTVDAGQVVKFSNFAADLLVDGTLNVNGTAQAPVVFTENRDDTAGGDTNNDAGGSVPAGGNWGRIELSDTSSGNTIHHADIRFGGFGSAGQLTVTDSDLLLANSTVQQSVADGVRIQGSDAVLQTNTYQHNASAAVSMDLNSNPDIDGVSVSNNAINGLQVDSGTLERNLSWNDPDIVYWLDHDVTVPDGLTLTVDAGQVVKFSNFAADLFVDGTLDVNGTAQAPVVFTEHRDDSAGGDTNSDANGSSPAQGNWGRIEMRDTSSGNTIHHADIRFGGFGSVGQLTVTDSDLLLANSTVQESVADGVRIQGSNAVLQTNTFENNNDAAASMDLNANPDIDGVVVTNNGINGLRVDTGALEQNLTWNDPDIVYWLDHDVTVPSGLTLTVDAGQVVKFSNFAADLLVDGTLNVNGTAQAPVVFTENRDDTAGGDTNNDAGGSVPAGGNWGRIELSDTSSGNTIHHADMRFGGFGSAAMLQASGPLELAASMLRDSTTDGLNVRDNAVVTATNNILVNNSGAGMGAESGATLTATNNTIDGNFRGAEADGSTTTLNLTNNLVTANARSGVFLSDGAVINTSFNDLFNPAATIGNYEGLGDQTGVNNNRAVDPDYVNVANLDYHLSDLSPAIDSATSAGAPSTDFDGLLRFDDPDVPNTGSGSPAYYDRGALEGDGVGSISGDFDADGDLDGDDIDLLIANIATGPANPGTFDVSGDGNVDLADRDVWLALAGAVNLASGNPYLLGDANLDGHVNGQDFVAWNNNKFTAVAAWTRGDFNADGQVNGPDFVIWNNHKFMSADAQLRHSETPTTHQLRDQLFAESTDDDDPIFQ